MWIAIHSDDQGLLLASGDPDCRTRRSNREESIVRKLTGAIALCLLSIPAFCQSTSKYQVAQIIEVEVHQAAGDSSSNATSYDVSAKVGDTIYVVLYTPPLGELPPKYATGHELLVLVEKDAITYNDMLGRSLQVPIQSRRPAAEPKHLK